jgi:L,D-peptidoglycan transpeptidase YkuD (ErfK/YbiS/YcfS/YnhG family)
VTRWSVDRWGTTFNGVRLPSSIGKGGISLNKREGDGATPVGQLRILEMYYRADRIIAPASWAKAIGPRDLWSDDVGDAQYNHLVSAPYKYSHEKMRRADPLYDLILISDWNYPDTTAGKGSAIFIHQWRKPRHPTEGCVAYSRADLHWIASQIEPGATLTIRG